jgi:PAS domain S-box-containing protein
MRSRHDLSLRSTAARTSERRYEAVLEAIDQGFCVIEVEFDAQGRVRDYRFLEINPAFVRLTGIENAVGRSMREIAPNHEQHWFDRYADVAVTGRATRFEHEAHALAGGKWFDVFAFRVDDPRDRHVAILFSDATERRQARRDLMASEARFRGLIELSPVGIAMGDPDGTIVLANDAFLSMLGYRREEVQLLNWITLTAPEYRPLDAAHVQQLRDSQRAISFEKELVRKDGTQITVMVVAQFMPGASDRIIAYALDISDRKRIELTLRDSERRLAESAAALRDADRRKDDFLATLAHELRNPLAPIRNGIELLRLIASSNTTLERTTQMMERQMQHLVRLVDDLLDVSRITRGKVELRRERVPINEVVATALESCQGLFEPRKHSLHVSLTPEPMSVLGDRDRLRQVFSNLLSNAAKFTPREGAIWVSLERSGSHALVRVRDSGIGIPPGRLDHVFEMFAQVEAQDTNDGLGIGLALAQQLVRLHGGSIEARSEGPGKGSEFLVCLPLAGAEPALSPVSTRSVSSACARRKVLIVDDNIDGAESLAEILRLRGHVVQTANGGEDAVRLAARDPPDVILLDLGMPGMDGLTAARLIRAQQRGAAIRIIALTGWGQEKDRQRTRDAGIEEHLVKPVSPETLVALFERD